MRRTRKGPSIRKPIALERKHEDQFIEKEEDEEEEREEENMEEARRRWRK